MPVLPPSVVMLGRPARVSLLPQLIPTETLANAVTWNSSLMQISGVIGPAVDGIVIVFSVPSAYAVAAASLLLFFALLARVQFQPDLTEGEPPSLRTLVAGIWFVWATWLSFAMLFLTGAFDNISMVIRHTLQQLITPNQMRGCTSGTSQ